MNMKSCIRLLFWIGTGVADKHIIVYIYFVLNVSNFSEFSQFLNLNGGYSNNGVLAGL